MGRGIREQKVSTDLGQKSFVLAPLLLAVDRTQMFLGLSSVLPIVKG